MCDENKSTEISDKHIKLFVKYTKIPITYITLDTIDYYLSVLDKYFNGCKSKWEQFKEEINKTDVKNDICEVSKNIIKVISTHPEYNNLIENRPVLDSGILIKKNLYIAQNDCKRYVSFDIIKGNFSVLRLRCPGIFGGANISWYDFVSRFTKSEFIRNSKMVREISFGKIGFAKLANLLQEHEVNNLYTHIENEQIKGMRLYSKSGDEIIYEIDDVSEEYLRDIVDRYTIGHIFHVRVFTLHRIGCTPYYYKLYSDGTKELRTVPKKYVMQVIKHLDGSEINKLDLTGVDDEGNAYVYIKSIF